ncbi:MAG TPA: hypothetical protein VF658_16440 [Pyrinomonadaceae bacterium]
MKRSNHPRAPNVCASLEDYSSARDPHLNASRQKRSVTTYRLARTASHLALHPSSGSSRLATRVRRARLASRGLAGRVLSPLHTFYATAFRSVEKLVSERPTVRLLWAQASGIAALSSTSSGPSPETFEETCRKN